ncbi:MAG TPA: ArsI/CadI family heavy metal resistance metalloenzyme [Thermoanaerobaculia bacterium]
MNTNVMKPHVSLNVRNLEASLSFYEKMLGMKPTKVRPGYAKFDVQNPPLNFAMNEVPALEGNTSLSHLGLQVASTDDVMAIRQQWLDAGLLTRDEMETECCYAKQDKAWVHDPDGNEWEVFTVLGDSEVMASAPEGCCTTEGKCATA